jgi:hypothetical protein
MVKRKTQPKSKNKAGYAARTAQPVHDSTSESTSSSSENSQSDTEQRETFRPPPRQPPMATARSNPVTSRDKVQKTIAKPDVRKKGSALKVLKDIRLLQKTTNLLIPRAPFLRLVSLLVFIV